MLGRLDESLSQANANLIQRPGEEDSPHGEKEDVIVSDDLPRISSGDHVDSAPSLDSGRNSRGGAPRFSADLLMEGLAIKTLRTTGQSWFTSWRRRQQGFPDSQFRLVAEEGNPADPTAVGVWLDDEQVAYIFSDDAERYTAALTHVGRNLLVDAVQTKDGFALQVQAPVPRALKKLLRTADPSTFVSLPVPGLIADGFRAGHDMRRCPAPAGDYSLPPSVWRPITGGRRSGGTTADSSGVVVSTCPLCLNPMDQTKARRVNATRNKIAARRICPECFIEIGPGERPRGVGLTRDQIIASMQQYHAVTGTIPRQDGPGYAFLDEHPRDASPEELLAFLRLIWDWPDRSTVNELFCSWHGALAASGVLGDGTERMGRGVRSIADDGHLCLSYGERTIDDWLHKQGIAHTREPPYPGTNYRGDFFVGVIIIEHLELAGNPDYDARSAAKRRAATRAGLEVFEITPRALGDWDALAIRLARRPARWTPSATPGSSAPTARQPIAAPEGPTSAPEWRTDPLDASGRRYFDGSGWTHHTLSQSGEWRAHSQLGDAGRDATQEWVRRERPMREAPQAALGKLGTHPDGLAFWLAAIDEHENGGQARAADSALAPAYRGFIRYLETDGAAMMAVLDRCVRFDRAGSRTLTDRVLHIFHQAGVRPDFAAAGLTFVA